MARQRFRQKEGVIADSQPLPLVLVFGFETEFKEDGGSDDPEMSPSILPGRRFRSLNQHFFIMSEFTGQLPRKIYYITGTSSIFSYTSLRAVLCLYKYVRQTIDLQRFHGQTVEGVDTYTCERIVCRHGGNQATCATQQQQMVSRVHQQRAPNRQITVM